MKKKPAKGKEVTAAEQLSFEIPKVYRREDVLVESIIVTEDYEESFFKSVSRSVSFFKDVLQGVLLVENGDSFNVIFGLRRVLAAQKEGLKTIPATTFPAGTPRAVFASFVVVENMSRTPNPASEAENLQVMMQAYDWQPKDVTKNLGIPSSRVKRRVRLLDLIPEFFQLLKEGRISLSLAEELVKLPRAKQEELAGADSLTLDAAAAAVKEKNLGALIPQELFDIPTFVYEENVEELVREAKKRIEKALSVSTNGIRGELQKVLKSLEKVQEKSAMAKEATCGNT